MSRNPWFYGNVRRTAQAVGAIRVILSQRSSALVGDETSKYEAEVGNYLGSQNVLSVASATAGLELVLEDLALRPGDEVLVPAYGWMSVPGTVVRSGATLRLSDVDLLLHSSVEAVEAAISTRTRAVVIVHMRGIPNPDTRSIVARCQSQGISVIEDCAQAWGATVDDRPVGTFGDYGVFSTQHYKLLVTGEGGVVVTPNSDALRRLYWLSGRTDGSDHHHPWPRNVRMPEIAAALGRVQLRQLPHTVTRLQRVASRIAAELIQDTELEVVNPADYGGNAVSVPIICSSTDHAEHYSNALRRHGLEASRPGISGDYHNAASWPVPDAMKSSLLGLERLRRYVDIPVPLIYGHRETVFFRSLRSAVESMT